MQGIFNVAIDNPIFSWLEKSWNSIWLLIDQIVYNVMSFVYQVFYMLTKVNLFDTDGAIWEITERIYVVFGVVMLFVFAYNILMLIANPDRLSGKDNPMSKLIANTVISIILVALLPTIFNFMYIVQSRVLESNIIGNIILGGSSVGGNTIEDAGTKVATTIFSTFYHPIATSDSVEIDYSPADCRNDENAHPLCGEYISALDDANLSGTPSIFIRNKTLNDEIPKGNMKYMYIISTLCGALAVYLFASFALDVGLRAVKLAVLQLVAPVPIMLRITKPTGGIFSKWLNEIKNTYISLFVRVAIIYFAMFTIDLVISYYDAGFLFEEYGVNMVSIIAELVLILSILAFAKEAPKLLKNIVGGSGDIEWNIKKKLNSDTYEYGRRAAGAVGTVGRNLGREAYNLFNKRNDDGTYTKRPVSERGAQLRRTLRNLPSSILYGGYSGWKNSGGNIEKLGQEIKDSSVATTTRIDRKEAFRDRAKENAIVGNFPGIGARLVTRLNDLSNAVEAEGGLSNYLGNRINYTTSGVSAEKAGTFRKHHANLVDSELIQGGVKGIKEQSMREEEHVREYYNNQNIKLLERQRELEGRADYSSYVTEKSQIEKDKEALKGRSDYQPFSDSLKSIQERRSALKQTPEFVDYSNKFKSISDEKLSFQTQYDTRKSQYAKEAEQIRAERTRVLNDSSLTGTRRAEAIKRINLRLTENNKLVQELEQQKVEFDRNIALKERNLASSSIAVSLQNLDREENNLYASGIGSDFRAINDRQERLDASDIGMELVDINNKRAANKSILDSELKRLKTEKDIAIRNTYKKNLSQYSSDIRAYYVNNLKEIRSEFSEIPVSAQRIIFKEAGFENTDDPNFNFNEALNEVGKIILDENYDDETVGRLMGFFKGLKRVENRGPFDYRLSRLQDATGKKDGDKK